MKRNFAFAILWGVIFSWHADIYAQHQVLKTLDSLISYKQFQKATNIIASELNKNVKAPQFNRGRLAYRVGRIEFLKNKDTEFPKSRRLIDELIKKKVADSIHYEAILGYGLLHLEQSNILQAKKYVSQANVIANALQDVKRIVESEYHLSEIGLKSGDFNKLMTSTNKAMALITAHPEIKFPLAPRVFNYKASIMHFTAKPDSANFYFKKAIESTKILKENTKENAYLLGTIYGNWFLVKQTAGDYEDAMQMILNSIRYYNYFLKNANNHPLSEKVHGNLTISYRNLGSLYYDLGDKEKAKQIATLGYNHAKKHFSPNTIQYFGGTLMMGESLLNNTDLKKARLYLNEAEKSLNSIPGDNYSYKANLYSSLGSLAYQLENYNEARSYYEKALEAYKNSNPDGFSQNETYTYINLAKATSNTGDHYNALKIINETLSKVNSVYGTNSYLSNEVAIAKTKILLDKKDYAKTIALSKQILNSYNQQSFGSEETAIFFSPNQLKLLFYLAKANRQLDSVVSIETLQSTITILDKAISNIEKRKSLVSSTADVNTLIENSKEIFDLAKEINLELFELTEQSNYLERAISLHESSIYNRIRTRLNLAENKLAPESIREKETTLRNNLNSYLNGNKESQFNVDEWKNYTTAWKEYLKLLQEKYPRYYKMRYASVVQPLADLKYTIEENTTLIRYFFSDQILNALIISKGKEHLVPLKSSNLKCISKISDYKTEFLTLTGCLKSLYDELWLPFEHLVTTENIIIYPDRELFNLSFELLTSERIGTLKDLGAKSLLAKHNISYNYSLYLTHSKEKDFNFKSDYIAFAPEFDASMKSDYILAISSDSINLDKAYLSLLPQPFSVNLVKKYSKRFNGKSFLNEKASKKIFIKAANEHKIIHVGTHAESNNVSPELSRLVFAKNISDSISINDNYLYTYEIYNQDLSANLAILTACETGKPTYQPGEGMISLAHAFNYAGSESILTSLWQIDEQSSAQILAFFYNYLEQGLPKDEAIRKAKLDYLQSAEGRTLHPQYWAGLILMGDSSALELTSPVHFIWYVFIGLLFALVLFFLVKKRKRPE
jgi:CHAT domain-containing protein